MVYCERNSPPECGVRMARPYRNHILAIVLFAAVGPLNATPVHSKPQANESSVRADDSSETDSTSLGTDTQRFITPIRRTSESQGVDWGHLIRQSLFFLTIENGFRCATEDGTREGFSDPFFRGYLNSVGNLHGWNDGDPFIVNYVGHPMQGAVSGYLGLKTIVRIARSSLARTAGTGRGSFGARRIPTSIVCCLRLASSAKHPSATSNLSTRNKASSITS